MKRISLSATMAWLLIAKAVVGQEAAAPGKSADDLAKDLANPVASLIAVPIQFNDDFNIGPDDGWKSTTNVQPVFPFAIGDNWNLVSRTILPVIVQKDVYGPGSSQSGLGDIVQSVFFSPKAPTARGGLIWGVGPVLLLPTGSNDFGANRWGAGPTGVVLKQQGAVTYGALVNHIRDFAGSGTADIKLTFIQPFLSYALGGGRTISLNSESSYDHNAKQWTVPVIANYSKVVKLGNQLVSVGGGAKVYVHGPDNAPHWGVRFSFTMLFPKS